MVGGPAVLDGAGVQDERIFKVCVCVRELQMVYI
jgi:hypothetical protein